MITMSNRTLIELNHDYCPIDEEHANDLGQKLSLYMRSADKSWLPEGVVFKSMRHHSEPDLQEAWKELSNRIDLVLRGKPVRDFDEVRSKFMLIAGVEEP